MNLPLAPRHLLGPGVVTGTPQIRELPQEREMKPDSFNTVKYVSFCLDPLLV